MKSALGFQQSLDRIHATDARYDREAYCFLRDALEFTLKRRGDTRTHISAAELLEGFRLHAIEEFGPMARMVLDYWGVKSCEDVGNMVYALIGQGVFGRNENDRREDFLEGYDFEEAFK